MAVAVAHGPRRARIERRCVQTATTCQLLALGEAGLEVSAAHWLARRGFHSRRLNTEQAASRAHIGARARSQALLTERDLDLELSTGGCERRRGPHHLVHPASCRQVGALSATAYSTCCIAQRTRRSCEHAVRGACVLDGERVVAAARGERRANCCRAQHRHSDAIVTLRRHDCATHGGWVSVPPLSRTRVCTRLPVPRVGAGSARPRERGKCREQRERTHGRCADAHNAAFAFSALSFAAVSDARLGLRALSVGVASRALRAPARAVRAVW